MNNAKEQAELYRKAAETIEMCAKHGIDPKVKVNKEIKLIKFCSITGGFNYYEFPVAVIEGQLVWADTVVYNRFGEKSLAGIKDDYSCYSLTQPKRTVMVELLVEDAEFWIEQTNDYYAQGSRLRKSCRKALDNLKGDKS